MTVRRTLPARERSFVGAWCFVDHYGPDDVSASGGMDVAPHPHCGLATVSWLFSGEVEHRDSLGTVATVRPGEVNLMTAGRGISHSEVSTPATSVLHGAQLWVVLPAALADVEPRFEHFVPEVVQAGAGVRAQVFVGSLWGSSSPVRVETPLVGAEVVLEAGSVGGGARARRLRGGGARRCRVGGVRRARRSHGVSWAWSARAGIRVGCRWSRGPRVRGCWCSVASRSARRWSCGGTSSAAPVTTSRRRASAWEAEGSERFGVVEGYVGSVPRIPAPALPGVRLKPRGNRGSSGFSGGVEAPAVS